MRDLLEGVDPEAAIAVLEELATPARRRRIAQVLASRLDCVVLVMDGPHDPHNGAAVLRSCDAFGVQRVHVVERTERFVASGAVAMGAERWVDVLHHRSAGEAVAALRESGHTLVGSHPRGELLPENLRDLPRLALVMGNEHDGVCAELDAACRAHVRVPMRGFVESLNLSVSAAILLAAATRDRPGDLALPERRRLYARALVQSVPRGREVLEARGVTWPDAGRR
ncbi:MAG: RNA methyltransferase [Deltaproteobacteria bacterium]|nr:RNA methyltransferase [Deltaproteobacteria bacterium]